MLEQQAGRAIDPLQIVDHQHHRALAGDERERARDRLEHPVAAQLVVLRRARGRHAPAQRGEEARELGQVRLELGRELERVAVGDVVDDARLLPRGVFEPAEQPLRALLLAFTRGHAGHEGVGHG